MRPVIRRRRRPAHRVRRSGPRAFGLCLHDRAADMRTPPLNWLGCCDGTTPRVLCRFLSAATDVALAAGVAAGARCVAVVPPRPRDRLVTDATLYPEAHRRKTAPRGFIRKLVPAPPPTSRAAAKSRWLRVRGSPSLRRCEAASERVPRGRRRDRRPAFVRPASAGGGGRRSSAPPVPGCARRSPCRWRSGAS
jgi:hypothetical protein